jgi:hypothetical protein
MRNIIYILIASLGVFLCEIDVDISISGSDKTETGTGTNTGTDTGTDKFQEATGKLYNSNDGT